MDQADELSVHVPQASTVTVRETAIAVRPLTVRQIAGVTRALKAVDFTKGLDALDMPSLLADHADAVVQAVAIAANCEAEFLQDAAADEFLMLAAAVVEVNTDFFVQRLAPILTDGLGKIVRSAGVGRTPFKR